MLVEVDNLFVIYMVAVATNGPIDVETGEWERGQRGVILRAGVVSTGVAVALSNLTTGTGYFGVFTTDSVLQFRGMIRTALNERGAPGALLAWYYGAALVRRSYPYAHEINAETASLRQAVNGAFDGKGVRVVGSRWLEVGKCVNLALRCGTDRVALRIIDDPAH
jgi:hypothetical protein